VFRSRRRPVVFAQAEHARVAAELAAAWRPHPPLLWASFVAGVALHDRGYDALDTDGIGEVERERWLAIQWASFEPRGVDPVVDLVAATHVRRLVGDDPDGDRMAAALPAIRAAAGVSEAEAAVADRITEACDFLSFELCFEEPAARRVGELSFTVDGSGGARVDPWAFDVPRLDLVATAYRADGYPQRLVPEPTLFTIEPPR
jgi:hypothetical protein